MYRYTGERTAPAHPPPAHPPPVQPLTPETEDRFVRDAPTVLSYALLACYTVWLYGFGPAVSLLRGERHFSYTVVGVYSALWSIGSALAGAGFAFLARRLSRAVLLWCSVAVATAGAALFTLGAGVVVTMVGAGVLGLSGTTLLIVIQAVLSDRHGARRDQALTEANVGAGAIAVLAPLLLGALAAAPGGWRVVFALPAVALLGLYVRYRHQPLPRPAQHGSRRGRLPLASWVFAALTAVSTAMEFCLIYFAAAQLTADGLSTSLAATALSSNYAGILVGRLAGAVLTRRPGRSVALLYASFAVTAAGFGVFWLSDRPVVAVIGLFVCGTGIANLYPLALALTIGAAAGLEDQANARVQVLTGVVVTVAPYLLGRLADLRGLTTGFSVEPVLIGTGLVLLLAGLRARRRPALSGPGGA